MDNDAMDTRAALADLMAAGKRLADGLRDEQTTAAVDGVLVDHYRALLDGAAAILGNIGNGDIDRLERLADDWMDSYRKVNR